MTTRKQNKIIGWGVLALLAVSVGMASYYWPPRLLPGPADRGSSAYDFRVGLPIFPEVMAHAVFNCIPPDRAVAYECRPPSPRQASRAGQVVLAKSPPAPQVLRPKARG